MQICQFTLALQRDPADIYQRPGLPFLSLSHSEEEQRAAKPVSLIRRINWNIVYGKTGEGGGPGLKTSAYAQRMTAESSTVCSQVTYVTCTSFGTHPTPELQSAPAPRQYQHKERAGMNTTHVLGLLRRAAVPKGKASREEGSSDEPDPGAQLKARLLVG